MAKKKGVCVNIDCENYKKEIEVEPGSEFECPLCHQPLKEKKTTGTGPGGSGGGKMAMIIGGVVLVLALGGGGYYYMTSDKSAEPQEPPVDTVVNPLPDDSVKTDSVKPEEEVPAEPKVKKSAPITGKGTVDLGYAIYTGDLKNGKPHGYGTLTYKRSQKIVSSKDFVANPGDTFEGEFRDGKISGIGYWKHDGNETAVKP
ncbi:hypothetical protein [uncultured Bacteroides sp.]|uniref:hypothetical protein n=1 Tax=uncultured Bacteroides sp. TaxID=162156 RepID=UPI00280BC301|nr:hypothetical protein [uncultured Bacteroides sp.]